MKTNKYSKIVALASLALSFGGACASESFDTPAPDETEDKDSSEIPSEVAPNDVSEMQGEVATDSEPAPSVEADPSGIELPMDPGPAATNPDTDIDPGPAAMDPNTEGEPTTTVPGSGGADAMSEPSRAYIWDSPGNSGVLSAEAHAEIVEIYHHEQEQSEAPNGKFYHVKQDWSLERTRQHFAWLMSISEAHSSFVSENYRHLLRRANTNVAVDRLWRHTPYFTLKVTGPEDGIHFVELAHPGRQ